MIQMSGKRAMLKILCFMSWIATLAGDSNILGHEYGMINESLAIMRNEFIETIDSGGVQVKQKYSRYLLSSNGKTNLYYQSDTRLSHFITILCKVEGVWSIAYTQWILCLLSSSFFHMKFHHFFKPRSYYPPLPLIDATNEKIFNNKAKYIEEFLKYHTFLSAKNSLFDIFYFTVQHNILTVQSLFELESLFSPSDNLQNTSFFTPSKNLSYSIPHSNTPRASTPSSFTTRTSSSCSPPYTPAKPQVKQTPSFSPIYNICHGLVFIPQQYLNIFRLTIAAEPRRKAKRNQKYFQVNPIPEGIISLCKSMNNSSSISPDSLPYSPYSSLPLPPSLFRQPAKKSHPELFSASRGTLNSIIFTYYRYHKEILYLQKHLLSHLSLSRVSNIISGIPSVRRFLTLFETTNLSVFTISTFCGPIIIPSLIQYATNENIIALIDSRELQSDELTITISELFKQLSLSWNLISSSISAQLLLLQYASRCTANSLTQPHLRKDLHLTVSQNIKNSLHLLDSNAVEEIVDKALQTQKQLDNLSSSLVNDVVQINEGVWENILVNWNVRDVQLFSRWIELAELSLEYSQMLDQVIDLEKLFRFPLSLFLLNGSSQELQKDMDLLSNEDSRTLTKKKVQSEESDQIDFAAELDALFKLDNSLEEALKEDKYMHSLHYNSSNEPLRSHASQNVRTTFPSVLETNTSTNIPPPSQITILPYSRSPALAQNNPQLMEKRMPFFHFPTPKSLAIDETLFMQKQWEAIIQLSPNLYFMRNIPLLPTMQDTVPIFLKKTHQQSLQPLSPIVSHSSGLLPFPFSFLSLEKIRILRFNLLISSKGANNFEQEMKFWLLMNHHPTDISSCFTYTRREARIKESFNSSLSYPDSASLYTTNVNSPLMISLPSAYGWKEGGRKKDQRLSELAHFEQLVSNYNYYNSKTEESNYRTYHASISRTELEIMEVENRSPSYDPQYTVKMQEFIPIHTIESMFNRAVEQLNIKLFRDNKKKKK